MYCQDITMPQSGYHDTISMCVDILEVAEHYLVFATPSSHVETWDPLN